jgi:hypothetical protein
MDEKLPAPCEHCSATGIFHGIECVECRGKGYRLIVAGRLKPVPRSDNRGISTGRRRYP